MKYLLKINFYKNSITLSTLASIPREWAKGRHLAFGFTYLRNVLNQFVKPDKYVLKLLWVGPKKNSPPEIILKHEKVDANTSLDIFRNVGSFSFH